MKLQPLHTINNKKFKSISIGGQNNSTQQSGRDFMDTQGSNLADNYQSFNKHRTTNGSMHSEGGGFWTTKNSTPVHSFFKNQDQTIAFRKSFHFRSQKDISNQCDEPVFVQDKFFHQRVQTVDSFVDKKERHRQMMLKHQDINDKKKEQELKELKLDMAYRQKMDISQDIKPEDLNAPATNGEDSEFQFYSHYKRLDRIQEKNKFKKIPNGCFTNMLQFSEKKLITPCKLGLVKADRHEYTLKANNLKLGTNYAQALSKGIKKTPLIQKFYLKSNRIDPQSAGKLIKSISKNGHYIDLQDNNIGNLGANMLSKCFLNKECKIEYVDVNEYIQKQNQIKFYMIFLINLHIQTWNKIIQAIKIHKQYQNQCKKISLLEYQIYQKIIQAIKRILTYQRFQKEQYLELGQLKIENKNNYINYNYYTYLHWNNLKSQSGELIFTTLAESSSSLKVLDISNNSLGNGNCTAAINSFFEKNNEVIHLDLSFNKFDLAQSRSIQQGLSNILISYNLFLQSTYGIHFAGNIGYIDSRGFLVIDENLEDLYKSPLKYRIKGVQKVVHKMYRNNRDYDIKDCCWICEGWQERIFKIEHKYNQNDPHFIHFNFENYNSNYWGKNPDQLQYKRVIPPGEIQFFFTVGSHHFCDDKVEKTYLIEKCIKNVLIPGNERKDIDLKLVNILQIDPKVSIFDEEYDINENWTSKPRIKDEDFIPLKKKKTKKRWTFPISLMAKWKQDNPQLIEKCFENDWEIGRIFKIVKDEEQLALIKQYLKERYKNIKDTYKYYASMNPVGDIWTIQNQAFWELMNKMQVTKQDKNDKRQSQSIANQVIGMMIGQSQQLKDADITIKWTSTIAGGEKNNPRNPVQGINRYQLMEILVRIAEEKYINKMKITQSHIEAVKMLWEEHCEQIFDKYDSQQWREIRYFNEEVDMALKYYLKVIEHVYKKFSRKKVLPGHAPFMSFDELRTIVSIMEISQEEHFGSMVHQFSFNMSMMTQIDETQSDRIFQMSQVEFYEALGRIADEASLIPHNGLFDEYEEWNIEKRQKLPLGYKLESLLIRMYYKCCDKYFLKEFEVPKVSIFWKDPNESEFELID